MNYKVVIEGEVSLSLPLEGDPNCFISGAMPLTITDDGVYIAPSGKGYSPITVSVASSIPWMSEGSF